MEDRIGGQAMIQIVIPMSGQGTRYRKLGYLQPKPLIPVSGRPMIERLLEKFPTEWPITFVMAENHRETELPQRLTKLRPAAKQLYVPVHDKGPGFALEKALSSLDPHLPVLVSYCDYGFKWDPWDFADFVKKSRCHGALISYRGFHAHYLSPVTYAYSRMKEERVVEVREKGSFTNHRENEFASAGAYYFDSKATLATALQAQQSLGLNLNGESYTSLTMQALLQSRPDADVRVYEIPAFYQWGTPEDLQTFEYWEKTFSTWLPLQNHTMKVDHLQMPMAGLGSRFKGLFETPKPFLKIDGVPMYRKALNSLPTAKSVSFVTLKSAQQYLETSTRRVNGSEELNGSETVNDSESLSDTERIKSSERINTSKMTIDSNRTNHSKEINEKYLFLDETPPGQAFSVQAGLDDIPSSGDIVISSCDHSIVLEPTVWERFRANPNCDAAIFTIRGFPGANRRPQAFAYVSTIANSEKQPKDEFPLVSGVSVKKPISEPASHADLLVGTFWFKNKACLEQGLLDLLKNGERVNGELYLDSIFNTMINEGLKVRIIPLDGYINWGDPDSLAEALYWKEVFFGHRLAIRQRLDGVTQ